MYQVTSTSSLPELVPPKIKKNRCLQTGTGWHMGSLYLFSNGITYNVMHIEALIIRILYTIIAAMLFVEPALARSFIAMHWPRTD